MSTGSATLVFITPAFASPSRGFEVAPARTHGNTFTTRLSIGRHSIPVALDPPFSQTTGQNPLVCCLFRPSPSTRLTLRLPHIVGLVACGCNLHQRQHLYHLLNLSFLPFLWRSFVSRCRPCKASFPLQHPGIVLKLRAFFCRFALVFALLERVPHIRFTLPMHARCHSS